MNKIYIATVFVPLETVNPTKSVQEMMDMGVKGVFLVFDEKEKADNLVDIVGNGSGVIVMDKGDEVGNTKLS